MRNYLFYSFITSTTNFLMQGKPNQQKIQRKKQARVTGGDRNIETSGPMHSSPTRSKDSILRGTEEQTKTKTTKVHQSLSPKDAAAQLQATQTCWPNNTPKRQQDRSRCCSVVGGWWPRPPSSVVGGVATLWCGRGWAVAAGTPFCCGKGWWPCCCRRGWLCCGRQIYLWCARFLQVILKQNVYIQDMGKSKNCLGITCSHVQCFSSINGQIWPRG